MPSSDTLTLLEAALSSGDLGRVEQLLDSGVKVNRRLPGGRTALSEAAASLNWLAREPIVAALLKSGADPNERDIDSKTPLMTAAISGCGSLVLRLVAAGALLEAEDDAGVSALSYAAACGHVWIISQLLGRGARVDSESSVGLTPLACASMSAQERSARLLIQSGARIDATDIHGDTALMMAGRANACDLVLLLAEAGADLYLRNNDGDSVLVEAIRARRAAVVASLRTYRGLEIARALVAEEHRGGRRSCGICGDQLGIAIGDVQEHFRVRHQFELKHSEVSRLLSEPLEKNRTHTGGGLRAVSGGLPSLGKRRR